MGIRYDGGPRFCRRFSSVIDIKKKPTTEDKRARSACKENWTTHKHSQNESDEDQD